MLQSMMPGGAELSEKLPNEIFQLVESFKKFVREQKALRDQKFDVEPMLEIDRDADEFMLAFQRVSVDSDINKRLIQQIRDETTKLLRHAELAYSILRSLTTNNPAQQEQQPQQDQTSQFNEYFLELADQFESRMKAYGEQMKELRMSLDSVVRSYNADELFKWLKKQHETLGEIAAKVYMTHERIVEKNSGLEKNQIRPQY